MFEGLPREYDVIVVGTGISIIPVRMGSTVVLPRHGREYSCRCLCSNRKDRSTCRYVRRSFVQTILSPIDASSHEYYGSEWTSFTLSGLLEWNELKDDHVVSIKMVDEAFANRFFS